MAISFNTPVKFQFPTLVQSIVETIDDCFALGSPAVTVVDRLGNCYCVQPLNESEPAPVSIYARIAICVFATLTAIPLLIKCIYRATHTFEEISEEQKQGILNQRKQAAELKMNALIASCEPQYQRRTTTTTREQRFLLPLENPTETFETISIKLPSSSDTTYFIDVNRDAVEKCASLRIFLQHMHPKSEVEEDVRMQTLEPNLFIDLSAYPSELVTEENINILIQFALQNQVTFLPRTCTIDTLCNLFCLADMLIYPEFGNTILSLIANQLNMSTKTVLSMVAENDPTELFTRCLQCLARTNRWIFTLPMEELEATAKMLATLSTDTDLTNRSWAQVALGRLFWLGQGLPKNRTVAQELFQKAAQANNPRGHAWLGFCYKCQGRLNQAIHHIQQASNLDDGFGHALLGDLIQYEYKYLAQNGFADLIQHNYSFFYKKAAQLSDPYGMARFYPYANSQEITAWGQIKMDLDSYAHRKSSEACWNGREGGIQYMKQFVQYTVLSAYYQTDSIGLSTLAYCYQKGSGKIHYYHSNRVTTMITPDRELAKHYYTEAAELGDSYAKELFLRLIQ